MIKTIKECIVVGIEIEMYVEKKLYSKGNADGAWVSADKWTKNEYAILYPHDPFEKEQTVNLENSIYRSIFRNEELFCILGLNHLENISPISKAKGLPHDVCSEIKLQYNNDAYNASWLTLKEITDFNWESNTFIMDRTVNKDIAERFYATGEVPESYANNAKDVVKLKWKMTYAEIGKEFLSNTVPKLREIGKPEDVRIVFWFFD